MENKRIHQRYQVIRNIGHATQFNLFSKALPGILLDLSAGGMALNAYSNILPGEKIKFIVNIPGLATKEIEGKVEWSMEHGKMFNIGISFTKLDEEDKKRIIQMAEEYNKCMKKTDFFQRSICLDECVNNEFCKSTPQNKEK